MAKQERPAPYLLHEHEPSTLYTLHELIAKLRGEAFDDAATVIQMRIKRLEANDDEAQRLRQRAPLDELKDCLAALSELKDGG